MSFFWCLNHFFKEKQIQVVVVYGLADDTMKDHIRIPVRIIEHQKFITKRLALLDIFLSTKFRGGRLPINFLTDIIFEINK